MATITIRISDSDTARRVAGALKSAGLDPLYSEDNFCHSTLPVQWVYPSQDFEPQKPDLSDEKNAERADIALRPGKSILAETANPLGHRIGGCDDDVDTCPPPERLARPRAPDRGGFPVGGGAPAHGIPGARGGAPARNPAYPPGHTPPPGIGRPRTRDYLSPRERPRAHGVSEGGRELTPPLPPPRGGWGGSISHTPEQAAQVLALTGADLTPLVRDFQRIAALIPGGTAFDRVALKQVAETYRRIRGKPLPERIPADLANHLEIAILTTTPASLRNPQSWPWAYAGGVLAREIGRPGWGSPPDEIPAPSEPVIAPPIADSTPTRSDIAPRPEKSTSGAVANPAPHPPRQRIGPDRPPDGFAPAVWAIAWSAVAATRYVAKSAIPARTRAIAAKWQPRLQEYSAENLAKALDKWRGTPRTYPERWEVEPTADELLRHLPPIPAQRLDRSSAPIPPPVSAPAPKPIEPAPQAAKVDPNARKVADLALRLINAGETAKVPPIMRRLTALPNGAAGTAAATLIDLWDSGNRAAFDEYARVFDIGFATNKTLPTEKPTETIPESGFAALSLDERRRRHEQIEADIHRAWAECAPGLSPAEQSDYLPKIRLAGLKTTRYDDKQATLRTLNQLRERLYYSGKIDSMGAA